GVARAAGERLLELLAVDVQVDRIGGQTPVRPGGDAVAEGLHLADLAAPEAQLDARAGELVAPRSLPLDARLADEHAEPGRLVELHRIAARGEVAAVDRHLPRPPHPVVALETHPVGDDDVRLSRVRPLDGRAARGVHLQGVPDALHRA